jgi:hypothetical protein
VHLTGDGRDTRTEHPEEDGVALPT